MRVTGDGFGQVVFCAPITWGVVCQTSESEPNWESSAHSHYFYPDLSHQFILSHLHFCSSLLTALYLSVSTVTSPPGNQNDLFKSEFITLLFINHFLASYQTTLASYHTQCKIQIFTMAYKVIHDLTPAFFSDLISHSSPFYSFCSSHTKLDVFGICWTHSGTKALYLVCPLSRMFFSQIWHGSCTLTSSGSLLRYHCLREPFPSCFTCLRVLISSWLWIICWSIHLCVYVCIHF